MPRSCWLIKPSAIYGTRYLQSGTAIPLTPVLAPISWILSRGRSVVAAASSVAPAVVDPGLFAPPVPVDAVAAACAEGALVDLSDDTATGPGASVSSTPRTVGPYELLDHWGAAASPRASS
mmetsp:Transcript_1687/g.6501  ORF Transcript_1687/g.6501 Transcript_1687/m.6501 type:complete len:121 (+) Transcript_1687:111-473(+)